MMRTTTLVAVVAICAAGLLSAQSAQRNPAAVLEFADDIREVEVLDFTGRVVEGADFGTEVLIGFAVRTGQTSAELRLVPNGSILRLAENTFLKFEELQGLPNTSANSAALIAGGIRMVAARIQGQNYRISTARAVEIR